MRRKANAEKSKRPINTKSVIKFQDESVIGSFGHYVIMG